MNIERVFLLGVLHILKLVHMQREGCTWFVCLSVDYFSLTTGYDTAYE